MYNSKLHFHFVGIGGVGMSGIAEVLLTLGFGVSGSDLSNNQACQRLQQVGASISFGHAAENLPENASLVVYSSAVPQDNPEIMAAHERHLPVIPRAEVLAELMRLKFGIAVAGSHGKTSTTSLIAEVLHAGGIDPTVVVGGQVCGAASGARLGKGKFLVAESDESDRSFLLLKPTIAVITNIDAEHLEAYSSIDDLIDSFRTFVRSVPFYGLTVFCLDNPLVAELAQSYSGRKVTFGLSPDADIRALNVSPNKMQTAFDLEIRGELGPRISLPLPGRHMVVNALAACAVGLELEIEVECIQKGLEGFKGVKRRLEIVGQQNGVTVISDYGHHPTELRATIDAIKVGWGSALNRLHVVFEPHRYSRTRACFAEFLHAFSGADNLVLTEIYAASERPIDGISGSSLCSAIEHPCKQFVSEIDAIPAGLVRTLEPGDIVLCSGAGSIGHLPQQIVAALSELR